MVSVIRLVVGPKYGDGSNHRAKVKEKPVVGPRTATRSQSRKQQRTAAASGKKQSTADDDAGDIIEKKPVAAHITRSVTAKAKKPEAAHITRSVTAKAKKSKNNVGANKKLDPPDQKKKKSGPGKSIPTESNSDIVHIAVGQSSTAGSDGSRLMGSVKRRVARKSHKHGIKVRRPGCDLPLSGAKAESADGSPQSLAPDAAAVVKAAAAATPARPESLVSSTANLSPSLAKGGLPRGVYQTPAGRFEAKFYCSKANGRRYIGTFHTPDQASKAYTLVREEVGKNRSLGADELDAVFEAAKARALRAAGQGGARRARAHAEKKGDLPRGVTKTEGGRFQARIKYSGTKTSYIGSFDTPEQASGAYTLVRNELDKNRSLSATELDAVFEVAKARALKTFNAAAPARSESTANLSPSLANVLKILRTDSDETITSNLFKEDDQDNFGPKSDVETKKTDAPANQPSQVMAEASSSVAFVTPSPYVNPSEEDIFVQAGRSSPESEPDDPSKAASSAQKKSASNCDEQQDLSKAPAKSTKTSPAEQELNVATGRVMAAQKIGWLLPPVDMAAAAANPQSEDSPSSEIGTTDGSMSVVRRMSVPPADSASLPPNFSASSRNDNSQQDKYATADMKAGKGAPPANDTNYRVKEKQAKLDRAKRIAKKRVEEEHRRKAATTATSNPSSSRTPLGAATASPISTNADVPVITKNCLLQRPDGSWSAYVLRADQTHELGSFAKKEIASVALGSFRFYIQIESSSAHGALTAEMIDRARKLTIHIMSLADNDNAGRINWSEWHRLMLWNDKYRQLCIRKPKDDAAAMSDKEREREVALLQWAECQRRLFRNKDPSLTSQMKILLDDINFDWVGGGDKDEDTQAAEKVDAEKGNNSSKKSSDISSKEIEADSAALSRAPLPPLEHLSLPRSKNNTKSSPEDVWRCPNCKHENRQVLKGCGSCHKLRPGYERPKRKVQVPVKCRWSLRKSQSPNNDDGPTAYSRTKTVDNRTRMSLRSRPARKNSSSGIVRAKVPVSTPNKPATNVGKRPRGRPPKPLCSIDGCLEKGRGWSCRGMCLAHYRESTHNARKNIDDSVSNQEKRPTAGDGEADANANNDEFEFVADNSDAGTERKRQHNALDAPAKARRSRSSRTRKRTADGDIETDRKPPSKRPRRYLDSSGNLVERKRRAEEKLGSDSEEDEEDIDGVKRQRSIAQVKARMYRMKAKGYRAEMETQEDIHKQKQREGRRRLEKTKEESSEKDDELDGKDRLLEIIKSLLPNEEDVRADKRGNIRSIRELLDDADVRDS